MAYTYTSLRNLYGVDTKNTASANLTQGDEWMNEWTRRTLSKHDWPFLHRLRTATTVGSTTFVSLPYDIDLVESIFVTVGSTRYVPSPAPSRKFWDELHYSTYNSDTPEYWFPYNGELGLWPRPSTSGNVISINGKIRVPDLNTADITSTTIETLTNGSTNMVVSAGLTTQMVGFWIRPTYSTSANKGDGQWYELSSIASGTRATLVRNYGGVTVASGTVASTIGQMPLLPEAYQNLPEIYASWRYWLKEVDTTRAESFKGLLVEGMSDLFRAYGSNDLSMVLDDGETVSAINPNLFLTL